MTTIAITWSPTHCTIMSESGITDESFHTMPGMNKIVRQNEWLIAVAGADRSCDVLQYITKYPPVPATLKNETDDMQWYKWMVKRVIPIIRKSAQQELTLDTKDGVAEIPESELILITHARAFGISSTLGVSKLEPYWAVGSGGSIALGALAAYTNNQDWKTNHTHYCYKSVEAATKHDSFSHKPIRGYTSLPNGKIKQWDSKDHASTVDHSQTQATDAQHIKKYNKQR